MFTCWWNLGCFQFEVILNKAAINIILNVSECVSVKNIPCSRLPGLCSTFIHGRYFQSGHNNLFLPVVHMHFSISTSLPKFVYVSIFNLI